MPTPLVKQNAGNSLELVDIKEIRNNVVVLKDGGLRQIIMVGGVNFALKSEDEQNLIVQAYQNFLNGIDFPLQVIVHSRKVNIDAYIDTLLKRKENEPSPLLQSQIDEYINFIKDFIEKNSIMEKSFLVVIPFYQKGGALAGAPKAAGGLLSMFGGTKKTAAEQSAKQGEDTETTFRENVEQLGQRTAQVVAGIADIGLDATPLENQELIELFYNFYNPQTVERGGIVAQGFTQK
jgi:type IV secretory pathway VirB4 component